MNSALQLNDLAPQIFDPALATAPVRLVELAAVVDLLIVTHAPEQIAAYREAMQRGTAFPPIAVVELAGYYLIADGHKRFTAAVPLCAGEILVEVWSLQRWAQDQWRQFTAKTRQQARLAVRSFIDRDARREAVRLFWDTVGHWRRIGASIARRLSRATRSDVHPLDPPA